MLFNWCAHSWWGLAKGVLQVVLFLVLCFKWSMKNHCVTKIFQGIWKTFLYKNNCTNLDTIWILPFSCPSVETKKQSNF